MHLTHRPRTDPQDAVDRARHLVDAESGIIRLLYESPAPPDAPQIFGYGSILADTSKYGVEDFGLVNGSTSLRRSQAIAGAVGEAVERYACRIVPYGDIRWGTCAELGEQGVAPSRLVLYDDEQHARHDFPYRKFDEREPLAWITGFSLTDRRKVWVPAAAAYMASVDAGPPLFQQTTNGLACGSSLEESILAGLYEVVERDASMMTWFLHSKNPRLDTSTATDGDLVTLLEMFDRVGWPVDLVDVTTDLAIPSVVAATQLGDRYRHAPVFSSAAGPNLQSAAASAVNELAQCIPWVQTMIRKGVEIKPLDRLTSTEDHVMWVTDPQRQPLAAFLTAAEERIPATGKDPLTNADVLGELEEAVRRIAEAGLEVVVVDLTPPDIADAGFVVTRTLVPGCTPLYFGSGLWRLGSRVLDHLVTQPTSGASNVNYRPHPFP